MPEDLAALAEDELWSLLGQAAVGERVEVLRELAERAMAREDYQRAMTLLEQVETSAGELGDAELVARAQSRRGSCAFLARDFADSASLYGVAADGFSELGQPLDAAFALWGRADALRMAGEFAGCLAAATQARGLAESEGDSLIAGDSAYQQARALYYLDREREALVACRDARDHFRRIRRPDRVGGVDDFALTVCLYLGEYDDALELARSCLVLARNSQSESDDPYAQCRLAETLLQRGELAEAMRNADEARAAYRRLDDLLGVARCATLRAQALAEDGREDEAIASYLEARVLFDANGQDFEALRCDVRRAIALHGQRDYQQAARLNRRLAAEFLRYAGATGPELPAESQWCVVRLVDNLLCDAEYAQVVEVGDEFMAGWGTAELAAEPSLREFLGIRAAALEAVGRDAEASELAARVIAATPHDGATRSTALCYEVRGRARLAAGQPSGTQDLAHAIALHLSKGEVPRARDLSAHFLPADNVTVEK